jgi:predicted peroxiredoxin
MFLTAEAVRLALHGGARAVACDGCPSLESLVERYAAAGGRYLVCPICFHARHLDADALIEQEDLGGTVPLWEWIGEDPAVTCSC